jgi:hypothetical protein
MNAKAALIVLLVGALAAGAEPTAPVLLQKAMRSLPNLRLLDPSIDLVGEYTIDELKGFGYWPPWITTDVDRDGRPDVVAVVVRPEPKRQFGVIAVHARPAGSIQWVIPLGDGIINGVTMKPARDTIMPLNCIECDSNDWYRWSGRSYEAGLYAVGERIAIAAYDHDQALGLFARGDRKSRLFFPVESCTQAMVRRVAGSEAERWYFVETQGRDRVRGWIPASFASDNECAG